MDIGIFAKTFEKPSLEEVLNCVQQYELTQLQFNMTCAGLPSMPDFIEPAVTKRIFDETYKRNISIAAVSGTFNMIHPNIAEREKGLKRLQTLAAACREMGTSVITLCTGTRDSDNMWRKHPENNDESAWKDLLETMEQALSIAEEYQVTLAFEPEPANVINDAEKGRKLLDEMKSDRLKVVMDAANLFEIDDIGCMKETMHKAFDMLGNDIVIAHAKDIKVSNEKLEVVAAGKGMLDYGTYLKLLHSYGFDRTLILHGLKEEEVASSVHFLKQKLETIHKVGSYN